MICGQFGPRATVEIQFSHTFFAKLSVSMSTLINECDLSCKKQRLGLLSLFFIFFAKEEKKRKKIFKFKIFLIKLFKYNSFYLKE